MECSLYQNYYNKILCYINNMSSRRPNFFTPRPSVRRVSTPPRRQEFDSPSPIQRPRQRRVRAPMAPISRRRLNFSGEGNGLVTYSSPQIQTPEAIPVQHAQPNTLLNMRIPTAPARFNNSRVANIVPESLSSQVEAVANAPSPRRNRNRTRRNANRGRSRTRHRSRSRNRRSRSRSRNRKTRRVNNNI